MTSWHSQTEIYMIILFVLHVGAVFFYKFFKKDNLITPMITGKAQLTKDAPADLVNVEQTGGMWIRFAIAFGIAVLVTYYISNGLSFSLKILALNGWRLALDLRRVQVQTLPFVLANRLNHRV